MGQCKEAAKAVGCAWGQSHRAGHALLCIPLTGVSEQDWDFWQPLGWTGHHSAAFMVGLHGLPDALCCLLQSMNPMHSKFAQIWLISHECLYAATL